MSAQKQGFLGLFLIVLLLFLMLTFSPRHTPAIFAQANDPTTTFIPPSATPDGTLVPTFIPAAPQKGHPLDIGQTIEATLLIGHWDIWEFEIDQPQNVTIRLRSSHFDPFLELYGPHDEQTPLYTDDDSGRGRNATLYDIPLSETGRYRIYARSYKDEGEGAYRLSLEPNAGFVPSLANSQAISYNSSHTNTLKTEQDVYYFSGKAGDTLAILLNSPDFDTYLELLDANALLLAENDDNGRDKNSALINITLPADDTYFIVVASYLLDASGTYSLELLSTPTDSELAGEISLDTHVQGRLLPAVAATWEFTGTAGQVISLSAMPHNPDEQLDLFLEVVTPEGQIFSDDDSGYLRNPALTDFRLPASGQYTVVISEYTPTIGGHYQLALASGRSYFSPHAEAARLILLDNPTQSLSVVDTLDAKANFYRLWATSLLEGQSLALSLSAGNDGPSLSQDFHIYVLDTNWQLVAQSSASSVSTANVATNTDYLVLVHYQGQGEQAYQLDFSATYASVSSSDSNAILGTLDIDVPITRSLPIGIRHAWQFIAPQSATYRILLSKANDADSYDPYLYILDQSKQVLAEDDESGGNYNAQLDITLEAGQSITILAASFADSASGDYTLLISIQP